MRLVTLGPMKPIQSPNKEMLEYQSENQQFLSIPENSTIWRQVFIPQQWDVFSHLPFTNDGLGAKRLAELIWHGCGCRLGPPHLFTARVEGLLQLLAGLWDTALLHGGEVVGVLQGDLQLVFVLLQRAQEVFRQAAWKEKRKEKLLIWITQLTLWLSMMVTIQEPLWQILHLWMPTLGQLSVCKITYFRLIIFEGTKPLCLRV